MCRPDEGALAAPCRGVVEAALGLAAGYPAILMEHTLCRHHNRDRGPDPSVLTGSGRSCNNTAPAPRPSRSLRGTRTSYRSVAWPIMIGEVGTADGAEWRGDSESESEALSASCASSSGTLRLRGPSV
jgi:hypothetical protein